MNDELSLTNRIGIYLIFWDSSYIRSAITAGLFSCTYEIDMIGKLIDLYK